MKVTIKSNYLVFPVGITSALKELIFSNGNEQVYNVVIKIDNYAPDFYTYIDVARFKGQTLDISVQPEMELSFRESDTVDIENLYVEPYRPQIHFTPKNGWINDHNGLIYLNGIYHMFYQYNPAEDVWGNMHWGHAESSDLIHWEEKDTALFPDRRGTMFSGCAVCDEKNLLGISSEKNKAALLFYTTTKPFCQCMSYSEDNFKSIKHYGENPVVPQITDGNRDPKVIFCDELGCYIMALYLENDIYCILKSNNLTDWSELQRIQLNGDNECPDIFPLCSGNGERKWIFMGANDRYLVGNFENGKFSAEQEAVSLHYGSSGYAGQSFSNLPDGRIVRIVWDRWHLPACGFNGQMGIPVEMSLCKYEDTYYIEAAPVKEIEGIYKTQSLCNNITVSHENEFVKELDEAPLLLKLCGRLPENGSLSIEIFGRTLHFDFAGNELKLADCTAPVSITHNSLGITVIADCCSLEVFTDGGKIFVSCLNNDTFMDWNLPYLKLKSDCDMFFESIEINSLNSIWEK